MYKGLRNDIMTEIFLCRFWGGMGVGSKRMEKQGRKRAVLEKNKLNRGKIKSKKKHMARGFGIEGQC